MDELKLEVISIKRAKESPDGEIIAYLKTNPMKTGLIMPELVMLCLKIHWMPLAMRSAGIHGQELEEAATWAIAQLEAQISMIRNLCLAKSQGQVLTTAPPYITQFHHSRDNELDDDDDEEWGNFLPTQEMLQSANVLGS